MNKKVLFVIGSLRKGGFNRTVADHAADRLRRAGVEVEFLDYANIPYMNQDIEFPAPKEISEIREKAVAADGIWFFTPEYNGFIPGVLKNLSDWLSRPLDPTKWAEPRILADKPVIITGVAGASAALGAREQLATLLRETVGGGSKVIGGHGVGISAPGEAFATGVLELNDEQKAEINRQVELFVSEI